MIRHAGMAVLIAALALLPACGRESGEPATIALIGSADSLVTTGIRLSDASRLLRAASADGLVGLDAEGQITPGLAERWIVTDDGRSYIFRLRERKWPDGVPVTSENARAALRDAFRQARGTSLGLDLAVVRDVRAMAGRVIEVRLASPMPEFLQLLAQPELALQHKGKSTGRMTAAHRGSQVLLATNPPELLGLPEAPGWKSKVRPLDLRILPARQAVALFNKGETDIVLGGRIEALPLGDTGPLSRGTVRVDNVLGLFGLQVVSAQGFLAETPLREALAMAIDRAGLVEPFNIGGWRGTTRIVPPGLVGDLGTIGERWAEIDPQQRKAEAARRVDDWRKAHDNAPARLSIALPAGPGADMLFARLQQDFSAVGVRLDRKPADAAADLQLVDSVARIADPRWFLNQFNCSLRKGVCSPAADARVAEAAESADRQTVQALLAEAEAELMATNAYIPFGAPLRWSLVRGNVTGFAPNRLGFHPLPPFAQLGR